MRKLKNNIIRVNPFNPLNPYSIKMKNYKLIFASLCMMLFSFTAFGQTKNLDISVKGIEDIQGEMVVLVFDNPDNFPKDQKLAKIYKFRVTGKEMTLSVKGIPDQDVAIFIYHDKDSNGKCNQNFIGMPTERIGFSNNIRPKLKAPKFEEAKVSKETTKISIEIYKM